MCSHLDQGEALGFCRHLCSDSGILENLLNSSEPGGVGIPIFLAETTRETTQRGGKRTYQPPAACCGSSFRRKKSPAPADELERI